MRYALDYLPVLAFAACSAAALAVEPLPAKYLLKFSVIERQYLTDESNFIGEKTIARGSKEFQSLSWKVLKNTNDPFDNVPNYGLFFLKSEQHYEGYTVGGLLSTCLRAGRKELSLQIFDAFPTEKEKTERKPMSLIFDAKSESTPGLSAAIMLSHDAEKKLKRTLEFEVETLPEKTPR